MNNTAGRGLIAHVASTKGGSGKTTLSENIAVSLKNQGYDVCIVDGDNRQQTAMKWSVRRDESITEGRNWSSVPCFVVAGRTIKQKILDLAQKYEIVIVDTAGRESAEMRAALLVADLAISPVQVSQNNIETLEEMEVILDETGELNPKRRTYAVIVDAPTHPKSTEVEEVIEYLSSEYNHLFKTMKTVIHHRTAYRVAPRDGSSALESDDARAKREINDLTSEILSYAARKNQKATEEGEVKTPANEV